MSNPYGPKIETTEDWNEALACCCQMPVVDPPVQLCESMRADFRSEGFRNPDDTEFILYKRNGTEKTVSSTGTTEGDDAEGENFVFQERGTTLREFLGYEYANFYSGTIGLGGCDGYPLEPLEEICEASGNSYRRGYDDKYYGGGVGTPPSAPSKVGGLSQTLEFTIADAEGMLIPDSDPPEFFGPCVYKITQVSQTLAHSYGYNSDGSPAGEDDDPVEIIRFNTLGFLLGEISLIESGDAGEASVTEEIWENSITYAGWVSLVGGIASSRISLPNTECAGTECVAEYAVSPGVIEREPPLEDSIPDFVTLKKVNVRYRWQVPSTHLGDYYKITWDVLYEPVGWDDESIPEAERPIRFSRKDLTVEWEGPGSGPQDDPSWLAGDWQALEVPDEPGERRVINVRYTQFREGP